MRLMFLREPCQFVHVAMVPWLAQALTHSDIKDLLHTGLGILPTEYFKQEQVMIDIRGLKKMHVDFIVALCSLHASLFDLCHHALQYAGRMGLVCVSEPPC